MIHLDHQYSVVTFKEVLRTFLGALGCVGHGARTVSSQNEFPEIEG